jgi:hypothetical protein
MGAEDEGTLRLAVEAVSPLYDTVANGAVYCYNETKKERTLPPTSQKAILLTPFLGAGQKKVKARVRRVLVDLQKRSS